MMENREEEDEHEDEKTGIDGEDIDERTGLSLLVSLHYFSVANVGEI